MKIRDAIKHWPNLTWGGSYAGYDKTALPNPATTVIEDVQVIQDNKDNRIRSIRVRGKADNRPVSDSRTVFASFSPEHAIFDRVVTALNSAIGKTLNDAGNINI
jgi:hypothetical protein